MNDPSRIYEALSEALARPAPFCHYTAAELWTDEHISAQMLRYHLDGAVDLSSRNSAFIERSVAWIGERFALGDAKRVADLGCGPGLYTTRLAATGAAVTGIDFSARSIAHARQTAEAEGLAVEHVHGDYLALDLASLGRFDLVTMIMCDFCALSPTQRGELLHRVSDALRPGGALLLDAYTLAGFEGREESSEVAQNLMGGFWSAAPYVGLRTTFKYEEQKVVLDKYTLVERQRTRVVYNWLQYFDRQGLTDELTAKGFTVEETLGSVAGDPYDPQASELAVIARR